MRATNFIIFISLLILLQNVAAQIETPLPSPPPSQPKGPGFSFGPLLKLNPSMSIILICLISAFFVMGCVSVYVRQCAEGGLADDSFDDEPRGSRRRPRRAALRGLDLTIIDTFPMFLYSDVKGLKLGKGALECAVCLNEFEDDEPLRLLPQCCHVFHPDCIDAWLASHITCPVCRANLIPKVGELGDCGSQSHRSLENESSDSVPAQESVSEIFNAATTIDIQNASTEAINPSEPTNQNRPPRSISKRQRINGRYPRSHSTGHLLIRPGEDCERFTLRLPEEARSQLMKSKFTRTQSCVAFPRARSATKGYRSNSGGRGRSNPLTYERFDGEVRADRWALFSRAGSTRSPPKEQGNGEETTAASRNLFRSVRTPFDRLFGGTEKDNDEERSFNRLRDETSV